MDLVHIDGMNEYSILGKIGEGSYSKVFKAQKSHSSQFFAIKVLKSRFRTLEEVYKCQEVLVMARLSSHPNILSLQDVIFEPLKKRLSLVIELAECSMLDMIESKSQYSNLTLYDCLHLTYQLLSALSHVHSQGYIHRDVKPENCLVNSKTMELKLADFGSTKEQSNGGTPLTEYIATRWYRAPECLLTPGNYGNSIDIWAVGCIFYELITKKPLFPGSNEVDQLKRIHSVIGKPSSETLSKMHVSKSKISEMRVVTQKNPFLTITETKGTEPTGFRKLLPNVPADIIDLFEKLLAYSPSDRLTAKEALNHPVFNQFNDNLNSNKPSQITGTSNLSPPLIKRSVISNKNIRNKAPNRMRSCSAFDYGNNYLPPKLPQPSLFMPKLPHRIAQPQMNIQIQIPKQVKNNGLGSTKKKPQPALFQRESHLPAIGKPRH